MNWNFFRDQIWNSIGVIVACIALLVSIFLYRRRHKKEISYIIISVTTLLTAKEELAGKIKLFYENSEVENVKFLEIEIINTGNIGIPLSDYEKPIEVVLRKEVKILSCDVIESYPESLEISFLISDNIVRITPFLLNSRDYFVLKLVLSKADNLGLKICCRIKDIKDIKFLSKSSPSFTWIMFIYSLITISILIFINTLEEPITEEIKSTVRSVLLLVICAGGILIFVAFRNAKKRLERDLQFSEID